MFLFFRKNFVAILLILILLVLLCYASNITSIPNSIILFQNEDFTVRTMAGIRLQEETKDQSLAVPTSMQIGNNRVADDSNYENNEKSATKTYHLSFLGMNLKTITADVVEDRKVIPLGNIVGLKLYTQGILVVGMNELQGEDNKIYKPYEEAGLQQGDNIIKANQEIIESTKDLIQCVSKNKGKTIKIVYLRDGKEKNTTITPVKTGRNMYQLGLWVRDAAAGVGTLSFYDSKTNSIVSLGHGIQDIDTGEMVTISSGEFVTSRIVTIEKGKKDQPGRIEGNIENSKGVGTIYSNTPFGVYGHLENKNLLSNVPMQEIEVAKRSAIKEGEASILCTLENGKVEEYKVKIQKVFQNNNKNNKSMIVKVIDERLLEKTGGIIQGMSGSPILQNGKLIGALTHVLVSDPTTGYGVFADLMLAGGKS